MSLALSSCGVSRYATISNIPDLSKYKYVYVESTAETTSVTGGTYGTQYGVFGSTSSRSFNPSDVIAGRFMKQGFIRVPKIPDDHKDLTIVINYGESGRKNNFWGHKIEVTLQLLDAATYDLICVSTAEGMGETEADDVRKATNKCLDAIFK